MGMVQIAAAGHDDWRTLSVVSYDERGLYLGAPGRLGGPGTMVLVRVFLGGRETCRLARQSEVFGRYEYLDGREAVRVAEAA